MGRTLASKPSTSGNSALTIGTALAAVLIVVVAVLWWRANKPVPLTEHQYATTMALYRVCNQRSVEGLHQVESLLEASDEGSSETDRSIEAIRSIIRSGRAEQWEAASAECRQLLEDQVSY